MSLTVACAVLVSCAGAYGDAAPFGLPSAVVRKSQLFVAVNRPQIERCVLLRGELDRPPRPVAECALTAGQRCSWLSTIDIAHERLLIAAGERHYAFPTADLRFLHRTAATDKLREAHGYGSWHDFVDGHSGATFSLIFPAHRKPDFVPLDPLFLDPKEVRDQRFATYFQRARLALLVNGAETVRVFHAHGDKLFVSTEPDFLERRMFGPRGERVKYPSRAPERQLRTGTLPKGFTEQFVAHRAGDTDILVTETGRAFVVSPSGESGLRVSPLWDDPSRPLAGVVRDADSGTVYGWGYSRGAAARFYVNLKPKPVAIQYTCDAPRTAHYTHAYTEAHACAKAFLAAQPK